MKKWYEKAGNDADVVISTRIRLARNLRDFPFPGAMSAEQRGQIIDNISNALSKASLSDDQKIEVLKTDDLSNIRLLDLLQKHIISSEFATDDHVRALALSKDEAVSIMIGEEDHLRIQVMGEGLQLQSCYELADRLDDLLGESLAYAYDNELGYLTHCPTNLGTGLRASVMLHLPALEHSGMIGQVVNTVSKLGLAIRGSYGEGTQAIGSLYQLSNQVTLGITEKDAIGNLQSIANQIIATEREARKTIASQTDIDDKIYRTFGILKYARKISSNELTNMISLLRMGISMKIIEGTTYDELNTLTSRTGSAAIAQLIGEGEEAEQRDRARAQIVRESLKSKEE